MAGPNSFGTALLAREGPDCDELLDAVLDGRVRGLVCLECDPFLDHPDPGRVEAALGRLEKLAVLDCAPGLAQRRADIFLPTTVPAETAGCFVNQEGRLQVSGSVFAPGEPLKVTGGGDHPPRSFRPDTPGDQPRPAWALLAALAGAPRSLDRVRRDLAAADTRFAALPNLRPGAEGQRVAGRGNAPKAAGEGLPHCVPEGTLPLLVVEQLFGSELLAHLSGPLEAVRPLPRVLLHADDGARLGLADGDPARLTTEFGHQEVRVGLSGRMAPGVVVAPRLRGSALEPLVPGGGLCECRLEKGDEA
jgi:NADH-quinone oxidoreductase subunit G